MEPGGFWIHHRMITEWHTMDMIWRCSVMVIILWCQISKAYRANIGKISCKLLVKLTKNIVLGLVWLKIEMNWVSKWTKSWTSLNRLRFLMTEPVNNIRHQNLCKSHHREKNRMHESASRENNRKNVPKNRKGPFDLLLIVQRLFRHLRNLLPLSQEAILKMNMMQLIECFASFWCTICRK